MYQSPNPSSGYTESTPGLAIAALICGIVGFCFFPLAIVALILGIIAMSNMRENQPGRGMALAGTILGGVGLALGIVAVLIAILLPALGAARRTARNMQNSTQLRGIHQGLITYANSNKGYLPGIYSNGEVLADGALTGNSGDGNTPQARYWMMFDGDYFTPEYAISPSENAPIYPYPGSGPVAADHYSYAMLSFGKTGSASVVNPGDPPTYPLDPYSAGRAGEWSQTLNSQAIVASDRNTGSNTSTDIQSIHTSTPGQWSGSVLWNDNHVAFETTHQFQTKYGNGTMNMQDHLFEDENGSDALMDWDTP